MDKYGNETVGKLSKERYAYIDLMKFIAIICVVIYHGTILSYDFFNGSHLFNYIVRPILATCVPIFFFVNGYLLFSTELDLKKHIYKTVRGGTITVIWAILTIFITMLVRGDYLSRVEFINVLLTQPIGWIDHLWFMGALVCIYLLYPILKNVYDNNKSIFGYFVIICIVFTFGNKFLCSVSTIRNWILNIGNTVVYTNMFNVFNPFRGIWGWTFVYFCMGGFCYLWREKLCSLLSKKYCIAASVGIIVSTILLALWGIFCSKLMGVVWDVVSNEWDSIFSLINVLLIYFLSLSYREKNVMKLNKYIKIVASNTLGIYFLHVFVLLFTLDYVKMIKPMCNIVGNMVYAFVVLNISLCLVLLCKKIPIVKSCFKL